MSRFAVPAAALVAVVLALSPLAPAAFATNTDTSALTVPTVLSAEGPVTWSVEPVPTSEGRRAAFEYATDPGTQIQDSFLITNAGTTTADFIIYATDAFNDSGTGGYSLLKHEETPTDLGAWITPGNSTFTLEPGTQIAIPFNLLIPSDAAPGDHAAGIVAAVLTETTQNGSTVVLEQRVGVRVYLEISGDAVASIETQGLTSSFTPSLNPFAPGDLTVSYDVRNTGNKRLDVNQAITVVGPFGIPLGSTTPTPVSNLLPRQTIRVDAHLTGIAALLYALSTVSLQPGGVGSAVVAAAPDPLATATPTPTPAAATPEATPAPGAVPVPGALEYEPVSAQTTTLAISWTLLALIILIAVIIFLVRRYVTGTREQMYAAIDEATAAGRTDALADSEKVPTP